MFSRLVLLLVSFATGWLLRPRVIVTRDDGDLRADDVVDGATLASISASDEGEVVVVAAVDEAELARDEVADGLVAEMSNLRETIAALQTSVSALDKQWGRVGREQFKANTLGESQQQQAQAALEQLRDLSARRESDLLAMREQVRADQSAQRLVVVERILPALDGLDEAISVGMRLLERAPSVRVTQPSMPPAPTPPLLPSLTRRQRIGLALGRVTMADLLPPPSPAPAPQLATVDTREFDEWRAAVEAWLRGISFVRERLLQALAAEGVQPIATEGEWFDPHQHVAIEAVAASNGVEPGAIVGEYRRGYQFGARVLRPAEVAVAKAREDAPREAEDVMQVADG